MKDKKLLRTIRDFDLSLQAGHIFTAIVAGSIKEKPNSLDELSMQMKKRQQKQEMQEDVEEAHKVKIL